MRLFAALHDDAHQGWVWLQNSSLPPRCVVKIKNLENGRSVYCEALQIDQNFIKQYNRPPRLTIKDPSQALVIGAWFRAGLGGINLQTDTSLKVSPCNTWLGRFRACTGHPQVVVRLAAWLGGIGFVLGVVGLALGIISIWPPKT